MRKLLAVLLVLVMSVSICSTAFASVVVGFEDQVSHGVITGGNEYYRKGRISVSNDVAKYGKYSAKIFCAPFYVKSLDTYTVDMQVRFDVRKLGLEDGGMFDAWFYFPSDCNIEQLTIAGLDKSGEEILAIDIMEAEQLDTWISLYDYWGQTFGNQDGTGMNEVGYIQITGSSLDAEKDVYFYMDNIFIGSESEFDKYMENPEAAVPVVDEGSDNTADVQPTEQPSAENETEDDSSDMTMWFIVGGVVAVALVAAVVVVVVAKKK